MIADAELSRVQRMRRRRLERGKCARCGRANDRRPLTTCARCAVASNAKGKAWRKAHPGYMAAYGKKHRQDHGAPGRVKSPLARSTSGVVNRFSPMDRPADAPRGPR